MHEIYNHPLIISPHLLPKRYNGPALTEAEWDLLRSVAERRAQRMPNQISAEMTTLLQRGILFLNSSLIGPIVTLGYCGCDLLSLDARLTPISDHAANLIYFNEALDLARAQDYTVTAIEVTGRALLKRGTRRHLFLARATRGGYSSPVISAQLKRTGAISRPEGTVVLVAPDAAPYARLLSYHPQLRVWTHALQAPPTTARTAPPRPGTSGPPGQP